jgi:hypothetical protein
VCVIVKLQYAVPWQQYHEVFVAQRNVSFRLCFGFAEHLSNACFGFPEQGFPRTWVTVQTHVRILVLELNECVMSDHGHVLNYHSGL